MALVANNPKAAKRLGIKQSVGEDFMKADKGKKFAKGGYAKGGMTEHEDVKLDKKIVKKAVGMHDKQLHGGKKTNLTGLKKGGVVEKGTGEKYASKAAMMRHEKKESKAEEMKEHGMKKGGMCGAKKYARGGGIEKKGKTKGKMV